MERSKGIKQQGVSRSRKRKKVMFGKDQREMALEGNGTKKQ